MKASNVPSYIKFTPIAQPKRVAQGLMETLDKNREKVGRAVSEIGKLNNISAEASKEIADNTKKTQAAADKILNQNLGRNIDIRV